MLLKAIKHNLAILLAALCLHTAAFAAPVAGIERADLVKPSAELDKVLNALEVEQAKIALSDGDTALLPLERFAPGERKILTRIEFDPQQKSTLVLTMQERGKLKALPGGARLLQLWDELWAD